MIFSRSANHAALLAIVSEAPAPLPPTGARKEGEGMAVGHGMDALDWCRRALAHAEKTGWKDGIAHYRERLLTAEYEAWANGDLSEISTEAMCHGSAKYRQAHPEECGAEG